MSNRNNLRKNLIADFNEMNVNTGNKNLIENISQDSHINKYNTLREGIWVSMVNNLNLIELEERIN